jgi:hypothetical protein
MLIDVFKSPGVLIRTGIVAMVKTVSGKARRRT